MDPDRDLDEIRTLVSRQFSSLSWTDGGTPDWSAFLEDFHPNAVLFPAARPARPQSSDQFAERMKGLVGSTLRSFDEQVLGSFVRVYGNVAVAVVACENTENAAERNRNVEMMLLVREAGRWRIAAQAWDREAADTPITPEIWR
jgi:hypothetical protein